MAFFWKISGIFTAVFFMRPRPGGLFRDIFLVNFGNIHGSFFITPRSGGLFRGIFLVNFGNIHGSFFIRPRSGGFSVAFSRKISEKLSVVFLILEPPGSGGP